MTSIREGSGEGLMASSSRAHADRGMSVSVTDTARQRLLELGEEPENKLPSVEDAVAALEVSRVQKEETGARPVAVLGAYGQVSPLVRCLPSLFAFPARFTCTYLRSRCIRVFLFNRPARFSLQDSCVA